MQLDQGYESPDETPLSRSPSPTAESSRRRLVEESSRKYIAGDSQVLQPRRSDGGINVPVSVSNVGHRMLVKMGWSSGTGLGKEGQGRTEPIEVAEKRGDDRTGIGKSTQDASFIVNSVAERRALVSEKIASETQVQREQREAQVARQVKIQEEVSSVLSTYRCELCNKQYKKTSELDAHLTSYDHAHRKNMAEYAAAQKQAARERAGPNALERRREKERRREAKELMRMAGAHGVGLAQDRSTSIVSTMLEAKAMPGAAASGWKSVTSASSATSSGWKSLSSTGSSAVSGFHTVNNTATSVTSFNKVVDGERTLHASASHSPSVPAAARSMSFFRSGGSELLETSIPSLASDISSRKRDQSSNVDQRPPFSPAPPTLPVEPPPPPPTELLEVPPPPPPDWHLPPPQPPP